MSGVVASARTDAITSMIIERACAVCACGNSSMSTNARVECGSASAHTDQQQIGGAESVNSSVEPSRRDPQPTAPHTLWPTDMGRTRAGAHRHAMRPRPAQSGARERAERAPSKYTTVTDRPIARFTAVGLGCAARAAGASGRSVTCLTHRGLYGLSAGFRWLRWGERSSGWRERKTAVAADGAAPAWQRSVGGGGTAHCGEGGEMRNAQRSAKDKVWRQKQCALRLYVRRSLCVERRINVAVRARRGVSKFNSATVCPVPWQRIRARLKAIDTKCSHARV